MEYRLESLLLLSAAAGCCPGDWFLPAAHLVEGVLLLLSNGVHCNGYAVALGAASAWGTGAGGGGGTPLPRRFSTLRSN